MGTLGPVPKSGQGDTPLNPDAYRGICVSSVFSRVLDRLLAGRLDQIIEAAQLRAASQCGLRKGCGAIDATYTLQTVITQAQHRRSALWAVFVDFAKAFDMVRRDLLLERCRQLGVHGPFLNALAMLYDRVLLRVSVNGCTGPAFATYRGTKQGSELSPLLFGIFMDWLHELILLRVPGAGPTIEAIRVPILLYADDVVLLAASQQDAQALLNCLDLFSRIFDMHVNLAPHKTCCVVFRSAHTRMPNNTSLHFRGHMVAIKPEYTYLGLLFHQHKGVHTAPDRLATAGRGAMFALLTKLRQHQLTQFDFTFRLFDSLVTPVMSYGAHVWGPELSYKHLRQRSGLCGSEADKVRLLFLRIMAGVGACTCVDVLLRDLHRQPIIHVSLVGVGR